MTIPKGIQWPEGMDEDQFLRDYWQQKPLLIRQALPKFETPLSADELAGLSLEPETTPRLITLDSQGLYHLEHGPFDEDRFSSLTGNNWSLLVTDVDKHLPELSDYLGLFQFLPSWRIDDLMVSYAPVGASVGAHVDEYDVFLLQASGQRQWSIDNRIDIIHDIVEDSNLKLIDGFEATDTWDLEPGDMLYLPPGIGHHGIAVKDPCTTWSIGFRAPAIPDMVLRLSEMIAESLPPERYTDPTLCKARSGEITASATDRIEAIWRNLMAIDSEKFKKLIASYLTEAGTATEVDDDLAGTFDAGISSVRKAPFTQMAWQTISTNTLSEDGSNAVTLFVNGDSFTCSESLAINLCSGRLVNTRASARLSTMDRELLSQLMQSGCVSCD